MQCVILAGGLGTRIRSLFPNIPKPMIPINGIPFIELQMNTLYASGVTDFVLCIGYKSSAIINYFTKNKKRLPYNIKFSIEKEQLGTGGAILNSLHLLTNEFMVINGDTFATFDLLKFKAFHDKNRSQCTILLAKRDDASDYGTVELTSRGRIVGFKEKASQTISALVNAGVYLVKKEIFYPKTGPRVFSFELEFIPQILTSTRVFGYTASGDFVDIGTPERLVSFVKSMRVKTDTEYKI